MEKLIFGGAFLWLFAMVVVVALFNWQLVVAGFLFLITAIAVALVWIWILKTLDL